MAKISVKVYEEIKNTWVDASRRIVGPDFSIEWVDNNGINTPYFVTIVNKEAAQ